MFDQGVIQQVCAADTLYETPCNRFVAGFVGDSNQFPGTVRAVEGDLCRVELAGGVQLRGLNVQGLAAGAPCIVAMRPERILRATEGGANAFQAAAVDEVYFGDHVRLRCRLDGGDTFFVKMPLAADAGAHAPGTRIPLRIDPGHVRVFLP